MSALSDYYEGQMITHMYRTGVLTLPAWAASTGYSLGNLVRGLAAWNNRIFQCVVAGTSAGSEPSWDTDVGDETTDNTVTWLCCAVGLPKRAPWHALYTATPGETGGGTEVTGGNYSRVRHDSLDANWDAPTGGDGLTDNASAITFPTPSANWGTVTSFAQKERAADGTGSANFILYGALTTSKTVNNGDPAPYFAAGDLDITFA